ncbi:hypothetical protein I79_023757 [Cricetulus griseus]|uniref:Uncharacterized protein n=1 Tax=Cricetulus griseus TaxID=10029 RepID=G3IIT2_CRIGR|nr:hypothetical protein I79_023757 [Cricetulus griseus]
MGLIRTPPHVLDTPRSRALSCLGKLLGLPPPTAPGCPLPTAWGYRLSEAGGGRGAARRLSDGRPEPPLQPQSASCLLE